MLYLTKCQTIPSLEFASELLSMNSRSNRADNFPQGADALTANMSDNTIYDGDFIDPALLSAQHSQAQADNPMAGELTTENVLYSHPGMMHQ